MRLSGSFLSIVLAMALLGPAPAAAIGVVRDGASTPIVYRAAWHRNARRTSPSGPRSRWSARSVIEAWSAIRRRARRTRCGSPGSSCASSWSRTSSTSCWSPARSTRRATASRSASSLRSVFVTVLPSEFATALLTAGVAFSYQRLGVGAVGLAAVVLFVFQYLLRAGVAGLRPRRGARAAHTRARLAAGRPAHHGPADAVDARRDDRAPLGRGRPLRPRGRRACSACREREQELIHTAGAAARHRQVHLPRLDPRSPTAS